MAKGTLYETSVITLNGSGAGTARLGPLTAREIWYPKNVSVKTNQTSITNESTCNIYVGNDTSQQWFRDLTFSGSSGDATGKVEGRLPKGQFIIAVWSGGDANVQAVLTVTGEKEV